MHVTIEIDDREAIYLGEERYLAGEATGPRGRQVVSWVPGAYGKVVSLDALVELWLEFQVDPRYETVRHPEGSRDGSGPVHADASDEWSYRERRQLRETMGKDPRKVERMRTVNARKKEMAW